MRRQLDRQDSDIAFQGYLPGCLWTVLHILDYHYWHGTNKISPRRKHRRGKHTICCGYPKTFSFEHYTDEVHKYLDADAVPIMDEQRTMNEEPTDTISGKDRVKALIAKEMYERSQLQRADSFSHLRPSDGLGGITTDWSNPIIILEKNADTPASRLQVPSLTKAPCAFPLDMGNKLVNPSLNQNYSDAKKLTREISPSQIMECVDVLEIFKINNEFFLEILQDPDVKAAKNFHVQLTSNMKVRLKKSGSFPLSNSPNNRHLRPSTLEHKWRETWSFQKSEKFETGVELPQYIVSKSFEDFHDKSKGIMADDTGVLVVTKRSDFSSSPSPEGSNKHGWHRSLMSHLKDMMKKLKHTLKESKKQTNQTSMDAFLHRVPSRSRLSNDEKEILGKLEEATVHEDGKENPRNCHELSCSHKDLNENRFSHMRRVSSLNESLDRYAHLFEYSLTREVKWHDYKSKTLRLINEDKIPPSGYRIKSFKRRLSLPDLDSFFPLPNETSHEAVHSEMLIKHAMDYDTDVHDESHNELSSSKTLVDKQQFNPLDAVEESELQTNVAEGGNSCENNEYAADFIVGIEEKITKARELYEGVVEPENQGHGPYQDHEIGSTISSSREHEKQNHVSVLETHIEGHVTGQENFPVPKGSEFDYKHIPVDGVKSSVELQDKSSKDCCRSADCGNDENTHTMIENHFLHSEIEELDDADFNYVKDVLEVSGLIQQGHLGTWHLLDQLLSPTLFKELEVYLHHEVACSSEDVDCNCDHQLLFDLINEVLLQIYESSLAYFPKPPFFTERVRPLPKGIHILEEVWKRVSWLRNPKLRVGQSLNDIVARDLVKYDNWMNLQLDVEDIALDFEDLIFDELIDEVICP